MHAYNIIQSLKQIIMKQQAPQPYLRLFILNVVNSHELSVQTYHNAIHILMSPQLPQMANQDKHTCMAAIVISHKLHQTIPVSVPKLCASAGLSLPTVLSMEQLILKSMKYKVAATLLIDVCLQIAYKWDIFIHSLTCINIQFFKLSQYQYNYNSKQQQYKKQNRKQNRKQNKHINYNTIAYQNMIQTCQKLAYCKQTQYYDKHGLALAIVGLCIKQAERHHNRTNTNYCNKQNNYNNKQNNKQNKQNNNNYNISNNGYLSRRMSKMGKLSHRSTHVIIADFAQQQFGIDYENQLKQEIKYVSRHNFGLKDLTHSFRNNTNKQSHRPHGTSLSTNKTKYHY